MARHPNADLIKEWAEDTSRVVQFRNPEIISSNWIDWYSPNGSPPTFSPYFKWRFKPEPKPDVVEKWWISRNSALVSPHLCMGGKKPNIKLTFDGETGKLIKAEVIE